MFWLLQLYWRDKCGASVIEYSLIAGAIALAIAASVYSFGDTVLTLYQDISAMLGNIV